ncbi:MAG TPA: pilus assembly protein PilW, partial [Crenotrichaceae bacterium]|nr:pilus assembly protein PilW [Crenotrichaceae bacterium]
LVIRGAVGNGIRVVAPMSSVTDDLQVMDDNDLEQYDIVMVADCISAAIIQITNADPDTTGTLEHLSGSGVPGNTVSNLDKVYRDDAEVMNLATHVFYIGSGVSGLPALFQKVGSNSAEELVEGVEGMQILYGEDIDGDASADRFLTANQVDMNHVISVRISILLQSITDHLTTDAQSYAFNGTSVTPTDHRVRRVFTTTISLRNRIP